MKFVTIFQFLSVFLICLFSIRWTLKSYLALVVHESVSEGAIVKASCQSLSESRDVRVYGPKESRTFCYTSSQFLCQALPPCLWESSLSSQSCLDYFLLTHSLPFPAYVEEKKLQILLQGENSEISAWSGSGPGHASTHSYLTYFPLLEGLVTALHPPSLSFYHKDQTV